MGKLVAAYALIGLIAFGHSASAPNHSCAQHIKDNACASFSGAYAAVFWPAYVSWVAFDAVREAD